MCEDKDHVEVNSESDDSNYEPNEETAILLHPSKTITSKMMKYSGRVTDIKSAFELVMPNNAGNHSQNGLSKRGLGGELEGAG